MLGRFLTFFCALLLLSGFIIQPSDYETNINLPYADAGLTERQAAAHLLDRFAYGAKPGDVDKLLKTGLENWLLMQLHNSNSDHKLANKLSPLEHLDMTTREIAERYPRPGQLRRMAAKDGIIPAEDEIAGSGQSEAEMRRAVRQYARENGYRRMRDLMGQMMVNKLYRAVYSENQLQEVLTDFWFNHFNVSITDNQARVCVPTYERDAIRPYVFGHFQDMLTAVAKHPAMLLYLDNAQSSSPDSVETTMSLKMDEYRNMGGVRGWFARREVEKAEKRMQREQMRRQQQTPAQFRRQRGVNENYARELMELHTLGVDGGYSQKDVEEVARAFTGWTVVPLGREAGRIEKRLKKGRNVGFVREEDFLFSADRHDATEKIILGEVFPAGQGIEEGYRVLEMLSRHPSTARHIAYKMAVRFISDTPPENIVTQLAATFTVTNGDLREMMIAIAESPEFWSADARRSKIKSPFELTVSALRALDAEIYRPRQTIEWISKMGQPLYAYQAPTGYPDNAETWVNSGSLLNRMNFGLNLAMGKIRGVTFDILALNHYREPASLEAGLQTYSQLLLPERDVSEMIVVLTPAASDPGFAKSVSQRAPKDSENNTKSAAEFSEPENLNDEKNQNLDNSYKESIAEAAPYSLTQVVGVILGSPEFQRR